MRLRVGLKCLLYFWILSFFLPLLRVLCSTRSEWSVRSQWRLREPLLCFLPRARFTYFLVFGAQLCPTSDGSKIGPPALPPPIFTHVNLTIFLPLGKGRATCDGVDLHLEAILELFDFVEAACGVFVHYGEEFTVFVVKMLAHFVHFFFSKDCFLEWLHVYAKLLWLNWVSSEIMKFDKYLWRGDKTKLIIHTYDHIQTTDLSYSFIIVWLIIFCSKVGSVSRFTCS